MKVALLHRYPKDRIAETNAAFPYLVEKGIDVLTFNKFDRLSNWKKQIKSFFWIFYAPFLVWRKGYDVIYCDDSYPFYPILVKLASPKSRLVLRIGDFHLIYYFSGLIYKFLHFFEKIGWQLADDIIAISWDMANLIKNETGRSVHVALDPIDPKDFPMSGAKSENTVMFHGVLTKNKGVDILLEAAARLPLVKFVIIGDGPDKKRLKQIAPRNVIFRGWIPFKSMCHYIETCAVGVALRSNNPGNEYVVTSPFLQFGVMGKPCLVTRRKVFGAYEWQFTGVDEMAKKLTELLKRPEEGEKLRKYVLENHDAKKISESIWQILS